MAKAAWTARSVGFLAVSSLSILLAWTGVSCGGDDSVVDDVDASEAGGSDVTTADNNVVDTDANAGTDAAACKLGATGAACATNSDCCSASCDPVLKVCASPIGICKSAGTSCSNPVECCTFVCD